MMKLTKPAIALMLAAAFATPASAGNFVTKAQVDRAGGYDIPLKDGSVARITEVRPPAGDYKACRVDIPSVQKLAQKAQDEKRYGPVPIRLQARMSPHGLFLCLGEGNGCMVIVMVPTPHA